MWRLISDTNRWTHKTHFSDIKIIWFHIKKQERHELSRCKTIGKYLILIQKHTNIRSVWLFIDAAKKKPQWFWRKKKSKNNKKSWKKFAENKNNKNVEKEAFGFLIVQVFISVWKRYFRELLYCSPFQHVFQLFK